jgi:hypothetical protein
VRDHIIFLDLDRRTGQEHAATVPTPRWTLGKRHISDRECERSGRLFGARFQGIGSFYGSVAVKVKVFACRGAGSAAWYVIGLPSVTCVIVLVSIVFPSTL